MNEETPLPKLSTQVRGLIADHRFDHDDYRRALRLLMHELQDLPDEPLVGYLARMLTAYNRLPEVKTAIGENINSPDWLTSETLAHIGKNTPSNLSGEDLGPFLKRLAGG